MKTILGLLFVFALIVALMVAVIHDPKLGSYICGGAFATAIALVLLGKL